jgi:acyl-coenzyme A synthetase/AMP-(fatty) acid ligase
MVADVVLADSRDRSRGNDIRNEIRTDCLASSAAQKMPAVIRFVEALDKKPAGKLARRDA